MIQNYIEKLFNLKNKTIILTGSAGLLGTQYAHALSKAGANVILLDINYTQNKKLEKELKKRYNTEPKAFDLDITQKRTIKKTINKIVEKYYNIYGLVNNATFNPKNYSQIQTNFEDYSIDLWQKYLMVNLTGPFLLTQEVGRIMEQKNNGVIVNISSIYGTLSVDPRIYENNKIQTPVSYAVTKGAIINFTRYLAGYWHSKNIRVNTLTLGGVLNNQNKKFIKKYSEKTILGRMANLDEYDGALLFLMSPASSYMTGSNLIIDGGWSAW